jgi:hypothetical protein
MEHSKYSFANKYCSCEILNNKFKVKIIGQLTDNIKDGIIDYLAAAPANHLTNFTGSGLSYPNEDIAFSNTPNKGRMKISASKFEIDLEMPNSYYTKLYNELTNPELMIKYETNKETKILRIPVGNRIPYRTLTYPYIRTSPEFYNIDLPVRTQERILRDSAYPSKNIEPKNVWGLKPPQ